MNNNINENTGYITPDEVNTLPESFGVYLMKNNKAEIIYVGKAKNLKKRVSSYFHKKHNDVKTRNLVKHIVIIDYISVTSEVEALVLEANLIKRYIPRYNINFKDNKYYPFIKVTVHEEFPRIVFCRSTPKDGSMYFGPYPSGYSVRLYIDMVQKLFKLRTCRKFPKKECLNYHINQCSAPCVGFVSAEEYGEQVEQALKLLRGEYGELINILHRDMKQAAVELHFEKAQVLKEKIEAINMFEQSQHVYLHSGIDADFVAVASKMGKMLFVISIVRKGKMVGKRSYTGNSVIESGTDSGDIDNEIDDIVNDIVSRFVMEYYENSDKKARYIFVDKQFKNTRPVLNKYFKDVLNIKLKVIFPRNADETAVLKIARENAELHIMQVINKIDESEGLTILAETLGLPKIPMRIEGFDIANIMGENAVASLVSFYAGKPDKKNYRRFKIRNKSTPDDFAMMNEAVGRRYKRLRDENQDFPDLILVDGGKGQLHSAIQALDELGLKLNVVSLAKKNEEIYTPDFSEPIVLQKNSPALHLLQRVRDETHRFANTYYNKLKRKAMTASPLDDIAGIGKKRKKLIETKFMNKRRIKMLKIEDLVAEGIPKSVAIEVYNKLKSMNK